MNKAPNILFSLFAFAVTVLLYVFFVIGFWLGYKDGRLSAPAHPPGDWIQIRSTTSPGTNSIPTNMVLKLHFTVWHQPENTNTTNLPSNYFLPLQPKVEISQ